MPKDSKRKNSDSSSKSNKKFKPSYVKQGGATYGFVPRSYGNPKAVTERKYFDTERTSTALNATTSNWANGEYDPATLNNLFSPSLGDDFNNRTGRKCQVLSIRIRGSIGIPQQANQTAGDPATRIRLVLVQDKQTNGAQLNAEDVINSGAASNARDMFQNPAFFGRFRILKDKNIVLQNPNFSYDGTNIEQAGLAKDFKISMNFKKPIDVHFNTTNGGTVADIVDNSFHVIAACDDVTLAPAILYKCRVTYMDV